MGRAIRTKASFALCVSGRHRVCAALPYFVLSLPSYSSCWRIFSDARPAGLAWVGRLGGLRSSVARHRGLAAEGQKLVVHPVRDLIGRKRRHLFHHARHYLSSDDILGSFVARAVV